jgi:hypothetical protein
MSVEPAKSYLLQVTAKNAQTTLEVVVLKIQCKSNNTPNVFQINVKKSTKSWQRKEHVLTALLMRELVQTKGHVQFQHVVIEPDDFSQMPLSNNAQILPEQPQTAKLAALIHAHWEKNCWRMECVKPAPTTREPLQMEETAEHTLVKQTRSASLTELANSAHHSKFQMMLLLHANR